MKNYKDGFKRPRETRGKIAQAGMEGALGGDPATTHRFLPEKLLGLLLPTSEVS